MGPNPSRYRAGYLAVRAARDAFAGAFNLNRVPPGERKAALAQGDADDFAALKALARGYRRAGQLDEAIAPHTEILNVNRAKLGPDAPATIRFTSSSRPIWAHVQGSLHRSAFRLFA